MVALLICAGIGFLQICLLRVVLNGALNGNIKNAALALLAKFACYGIAFTLLWFFFMESIIYAAAGFIVGVIASIIFIAVKGIGNNSGKGDGSDEHGRAD